MELAKSLEKQHRVKPRLIKKAMIGITISDKKIIIVQKKSLNKYRNLQGI